MGIGCGKCPGGPVKAVNWCVGNCSSAGDPRCLCGGADGAGTKQCWYGLGMCCCL